MRWLWLAAAFVVALACTSEPAAPPPVSPSFWRVEGPDQSEIYVLGSVHVGHRSGFSWPNHIEAAFARAATLVVEVDLRDEALAEVSARSMFLPPDENLRTALGEPLWKRVEERAIALQLPPAMLLRVKPWAAALALAEAQFAELGYEAEGGVDLAFLQRARDTKSVAALETAAQQLSLFDDLGEEAGRALLEEILQERAGLAEQVEAMMDAWARGDDEALEQWVFGAPDNVPEEVTRRIHERLYYARNEAMAARIAVLATEVEGPLFVVVGAGHVVGPRGLPALLAARGYATERRTGAGT
ncbi:MAG: TraB/GumN family protein [Proteobacteria bacterium]|nr:TraB/GumN family protein [Pseudomonadota bacterium]